MTVRFIEDIKVEGKTVLCRVDLNVPMKHGKVEDATRILRLVPTLDYLIDGGAKVVVLSHFGRPKGEFNMDYSLAPLADELSRALGGREVKFAVDCVGYEAEEAVAKLDAGDVLLLENVRFHKGETKNDPEFVQKLAKLGDIFVNDTFSCSHRSHASLVGLAEQLPAYAGKLMFEEISQLEKHLLSPELPLAAIVGGSKVSTKIALLESLISTAKFLFIGGAMANTFLVAQGNDVGASLVERDYIDIAKTILAKADDAGCKIILPQFGVVATELKDRAQCKVVAVDDVPSDAMILDIGMQSLAELTEVLRECKTVLWNGPMGAFEYSPFDVGSICVARIIAGLSSSQGLCSVAGGGDVIAALGRSGLTEEFTYTSTAGGAFLEWLEHKSLVGIDVLREDSISHKKIV